MSGVSGCTSSSPSNAGIGAAAGRARPAPGQAGCPFLGPWLAALTSKVSTLGAADPSGLRPVRNGPLGLA